MLWQDPFPTKETWKEFCAPKAHLGCCIRIPANVGEEKRRWGATGKWDGVQWQQRPQPTSLGALELASLQSCLEWSQLVSLSSPRMEWFLILAWEKSDLWLGCRGPSCKLLTTSSLSSWRNEDPVLKVGGLSGKPVSTIYFNMELRFSVQKLAFFFSFLILIPRQGSKVCSPAGRWKHGVPVTGPPEKSKNWSF